MNKKRFAIIATSLSLSLLIGSLGGYLYGQSANKLQDHSSSIVHNYSKLEEEFWNVDLIIQGVVISQEQSFQKPMGVPSKVQSLIDITPAKIKIDKILYGDLESDTITFLQHGTPDNDLNKNLVEESEEVLLILTKTDNGEYWSYNFEDGLWKVNNGMVTSKSNSSLLNPHSLNSKSAGQRIEDFIEIITNAAENKRVSTE